jgi:hypothetical protein
MIVKEKNINPQGNINRIKKLNGYEIPINWGFFVYFVVLRWDLTVVQAGLEFTFFLPYPCNSEITDICQHNQFSGSFFKNGCLEVWPSSRMLAYQA